MAGGPAPDHEECGRARLAALGQPALTLAQGQLGLPGPHHNPSGPLLGRVAEQAVQAGEVLNISYKVGPSIITSLVETGFEGVLISSFHPVLLSFTCAYFLHA